MIVLLLHVHRLKGKELGVGFFSLIIFLNQLIYTNLLIDPLILQFNEIILNSNHVLFHRVDTIYHTFHYICHILCCIFVR